MRLKLPLFFYGPEDAFHQGPVADKYLASFYSVLRLLTGLASEALRAWKLTVQMVISNTPAEAYKKISTPKSILY